MGAVAAVGSPVALAVGKGVAGSASGGGGAKRGVAGLCGGTAIGDAAGVGRGVASSGNGGGGAKRGAAGLCGGTAVRDAAGVGKGLATSGDGGGSAKTGMAGLSGGMAAGDVPVPKVAPGPAEGRPLCRSSGGDGLGVAAAIGRVACIGSGDAGSCVAAAGNGVAMTAICGGCTCEQFQTHSSESRALHKTVLLYERNLVVYMLVSHLHRDRQVGLMSPLETWKAATVEGLQ